MTPSELHHRGRLHDEAACPTSAAYGPVTAAIAPSLVEAENTDDAIERIAAVLGIDEIRVVSRLSRFSLFTLTRGGHQARERTLARLREEP